MSTTEILEQVLDPLLACLTPDAAQKIVGLRANPAIQARVDYLADRANDGLLTPDEQADYDRILATYQVITILQSKARQYLSANQAS